MSAGHLHGRRGILRTFPAVMRSKVDLALTHSIALWWDPVLVWESWPQCLVQTLPGLVGLDDEAEGSAVAYLQAKSHPRI